MLDAASVRRKACVPVLGSVIFTLFCVHVTDVLVCSPGERRSLLCRSGPVIEWRCAAARSDSCQPLCMRVLVFPAAQYGVRPPLSTGEPITVSMGSVVVGHTPSCRCLIVLSSALRSSSSSSSGPGNVPSSSSTVGAEVPLAAFSFLCVRGHQKCCIYNIFFYF